MEEELDLRHWRKMPETRWLLRELKETFILDNPVTWEMAGSWEQTNSLKGQALVMHRVEALINDT